LNSIGSEFLTRLVDQHGGPLALYARQWCAAPEDVVQEAFLRLVQEPALPENVVGWLYRVVRNGAISASRSASRRLRREAAVARCGEAWFDFSPAEGLDAATATAALEQLPLEEREVVIARLWGGLGFEQVAELAGCSVSTAHRRYQTALATLRQRLSLEERKDVCPRTKKRATN
jgi:RNA polymerase sigma factor (sigma-70 family)